MSARQPIGALDGVRVIDLTNFLAGPYATMLLADQGAEVIKIESIEGDYTRFNNPFRADDQERSISGFFASINRNKRSIAVDLKKPGASDLVMRMCADADVVIENFRAGVMDRLGLSYETLHQKFPRLVYVTIRGFGDPRTGKSPYADWPAYDVIAQAVGGIMGVTGPDANTPLKIGPGIGDIIPAMLAAFGTVSAVLRARQTGQGQFVDVGMVDSILAATERIVHQHAYQGVVPRPAGNRHPMFSPFGMFPTADGWATIAAHSDPWFRQLCSLLGREDLIDDPRSSTQQARVDNQDFVYDEIGKSTARLTKRQLRDLIGGKVPVGPVNDVADIFADPHFAAREMLVDVEHPGCDTPVKTIGIPIKMTETPGRIRQRAARLGEHTEEIMAEFGYAPEEIADMRHNKVIA